MRLFALSLLVSVAFAQAQPGEASEKARLEGTVVSTTGEPIPRAQIRLQGPASPTNGQFTQGTTYTATSSADGKWAIEKVDPGSDYRLTAQRQGFVNSSYGSRSVNTPGTPLAISAGQVLTGLTITMTPQAVISGRVTDQAGDPIQNVVIQVTRRTYNIQGRQLQPVGSAQTNDLGEFRVANLPPGRYYLSAVERSARVSAGSGEAYQTTYYPNALDPQGAAPLDLAAGADLRGIDIRLRMAKVFQARGRVLGPDGQPASGVVLTHGPIAGTTGVIPALRTRTQVRPDGTFEAADLPPGTYRIETATNAVVDGVPAPKLVGRVEFTVSNADVDGLTIALSPGVAITGNVRLEEGDIKTLLGPPPNSNRQFVTTAPNGTFLIGGSLARMTVLLSEVVPGAAGTAPGPVAEDGSFKLEGVSPARYRLNIAGIPPTAYIKSATLDGTDILRNGLDVTAGGGTLEIVLGNKPGEVSGTVQTEQNQPAAGILVSMWPADAPIDFPASARFVSTTNQNGAFRFTGLRPGTYYVAAWQEIEAGLTQVAEFLSQFTGEAKKITVEEGATATTQLKPIPTARIQAAEAKLP